MITITKRPQRYTPSNNSINYQFNSDNPNIVYFKVDVLDSDSSALMLTAKATPTPQTPSGSYFNLSKVLSNTVNWELDNNIDVFIAPMVKTVRGYKVGITEYNVSGSSLVSGTTTLTDTSYVFNGELDRIKSNNFLQSKYVINSLGVVHFLTNKPNNARVNDISSEYLYLLQDGSLSGLYARVRTYKDNGSNLTTKVVALNDLASYKMFRLNVSPKSLKQVFNIDFGKVAYYVVDVVDHVYNPKTEERVYVYDDTECNLEYMNVLFVNSLGGLDSYQFIQPQESININRFSIKKNVSTLGADGELSDVHGLLYNPSDAIINSTTTASVKLVSQELKDVQAYWLQELFSSKQIFIELPDGYFVPASLTNTSYNIPRLKYRLGEMNTINIELTLADGIIPSGSHAYSTNRSNIDFIDSQMNALANGLDSYGIQVTTPDTNDYSDEDYSEQYG